MNHTQPNRRALFLVNRHSRNGRRLAKTAITILESLGFTLLDIKIDSCEQLCDTIRQYRSEVDLAIIGGGDGTLNGAIAALVDTQLPLGILPLGTANDLARTLNIPVDLQAACEIIATGKTKAIDLGWVNGHYFFNVASLGLSVRITNTLTKDIKRRWGILAYAITALEALKYSKPFKAVIEVNGEVEEVKTIQIAVGNGRFYGGGMTVAPEAKIDDNQLDLYSLNTEHWWQIFVIFPVFYWGYHDFFASVKTWQTQDFTVRTTRPHSISLDGEVKTHTPAHFRVIQQAITVITP